MDTRIRLTTLIATIACLLGVLAPARAQSPVGLESLQIALWPEFDREGVLVLVDGALQADTTLPATVTLTLPAEPFAVAEQAPDGSLLNAQYTTAASGQGFAVTLTLSQPSFRVEYYDPGLVREGDLRSYDFAWPTPFSVEKATVRVQAPFGATDMTLSPEFGAPTPGEYGLSYYGLNLGAVEAGDTISATLRYAKTGSALTVDQVDTGSTSSSAEPTAQAVAGAAPVTDYTPWLLSAVVVLVAAGLIAIVWARGRSDTTAPRSSHSNRRTRRPARSSSAPPAAPVAPATRRKFCSQCGEAIAAEDRFCRRCGAAVKA